MNLRPPLLLGLGFMCLAGCQIDARYKPSPLGRVGPVPFKNAISVPDLIAHYNANAAKLSKIYAHTSLTLTWRETRKDGSTKDREESGDGKIIFQAPGNTVVTVEKLGKWYLWAGSNQTHYWLFDRTQDEHVLSFGRLGGPAAKRNFLGLPVRPQDMPLLLGLKPLESTPQTQLAWCIGSAGQSFYLLEQPGVRLLLNPTTAWPVRVELTNAQKEAQVAAELSGAVVGDNGGALRETIEIFPTNHSARLHIEVKSVETNSPRAKPALFDLEGALIPANKPDRKVDLDQPQD